jgi:2-iminobutanoate/2-iminopropanoate deaminase
VPRIGIQSPTAAAVGPYSHAAEHDGFVYLSGQTPLKPGTTELVGGGIGVQTQQCFDNLLSVLAAAGLTAADVVKCNVFLTDMNDFAAMNAIYATQFTEPFPARTTIGVASLPLGASIEIELIATRSPN